MSPAVESARRDLVIGVSPFQEVDLGLVDAVGRGGGLGVLDCGRGDGPVLAALEEAAQRPHRPVSLRVPAGCALSPGQLPAGLSVDTLLLGPGSPWRPGDAGGRVLAEVTDRESARAALAAGAHGVIIRGQEAGGPVSDLSSFVLLQHLRADLDPAVPIWVWGGIGVRAAVAVVTAGATGVVLDTQLALLDGCEVADDVAAALFVMDGSETSVLAGHRLLVRPGSAAAVLGAGPEPTAAQVSGRLGGRSLSRDLVPIGQDGFLAAEFARRFGTVERAVHAVRTAMTDSIGGTAAAAALRPGSALAGVLGTELPVVQGPMTRVSDRPDFAASVAAGGAMPFLALAMSRGEQSRTLLARTRAAVGNRPWGAGILGFVPEDLRTAQLAAIHADPPSCVIIAGGRPTQAAALEQAGIPTFLHVPSPRLLEQFLAAGARRFIFEGAECGGHVGPRASLPLWEAQIGVVTDYLRKNPGAAPELSLLFAGGVHDAVSAAAVAAMAEPLSELGAGVGVLVGTAYLFTTEAVADGAIGPVFQREIQQAAATELLTTAPGHTTRCVGSPFTAEFRRTRAELLESGVPDREVWEALEELNVGRLRTASKGLRRDGSELVEVDEADQLAEGLFMAGQVAVLRQDTTTVEELHADLTTRAALGLEHRRAELAVRLGVEVASPAGPDPVDVAVIGMSCMFPQAADLGSFWANILDGVDAITPVPASRWSADVYFDPDGAHPGAAARTPSRWGGFIPRVGFDALRYGIPPASLPSIDPSQLLALDVARRALEDAGYGEDSDFDRSRTGVVFAAEAGGDLNNAIALRTTLPTYIGPLPDSLVSRLPALTEDVFPGVLANVVAGRIANRLDLGGPSYAVDAACASSLTAVDLACKELRQGTSDTVVAGASDLHNSINDFVLFSSVGALSPSGSCRAFDTSADGIALGEGVAAVVLKRLADAERDGDRIYAVIKGIGGASDGRALGLTAPRREGQRRALEAAYANAGVSPADVGLLEAHGTGTVVGDRTELSALEDVFGAAGAAPATCTLGSVKSQIGHTKCAAGLAGLIKAALAVRYGVRPPTAHVRAPNEAWQRERSPFAFQTTPVPWAAAPAERIAGVSAFGFGGANYHLVLAGHSAASDPLQALDRWPAELFTFRGATEEAARTRIEEILTLATGTTGDNGLRLRDLARTCSMASERRRDPVQVSLVATDVDHLVALARHALSGDPKPVDGLFRRSSGFHPDDAAPLSPDSVALLFPGQGSQRPGMLADLFVAFPQLQPFLRLGAEWSATIHPPAAFDADTTREQRDALRDTRTAQPALGVLGLAAHRLLTGLGVEASHTGGHSYGELVALAASGVFTPATLLELSRARAQAVLGAAGADPGTMAAVAGSREQVQAALDAAALAPDVVVANDNAPRQAVISGPTEAVGRAVAAMADAGLSARPIPVACAFHSPVVAEGGQVFAAALEGVEPAAAHRHVWSNRTAARYPDDPDGVRAELAAQIGAPVRFRDQVEAMYAAGVRVFVEAGPGSVLTGLVDAVLGDRPHTAVAVDGGRGHGLLRLLQALARLSVAGVPVRTGRLFRGRDAVDLVATPAPRRPAWTIDGHLVLTADGRLLPGGLQPAPPADQLLTLPSLTPTPAASIQTSAASPQTSAASTQTSAALTPALTGPAPAPVPNGTSALNGVVVTATPTHPTTAGTDHQHEVVTEFLRLGRDLVNAQRDVMLSYLAGGAPATPAAHGVVGASPSHLEHTWAAAAVAAAPMPAPVVEPPAVTAPGVAAPGVPAPGVPAPGVPAPGVPAPGHAAPGHPAPGDATPGVSAPHVSTPHVSTPYVSAPHVPAHVSTSVVQAPGLPVLVVEPAPGGTDLLAAVLEVIAERTGYPMDMLEPDLDLEADLSIDSIKRTEMVGILARQLVPAEADADQAALEMPSSVRTAAAMAQWLGDQLTPAETKATPAVTGPRPTPVAAPPVASPPVASTPVAPAPSVPTPVAAAPSATPVRHAPPVSVPATAGGIAPRRFVEKAVPAFADPDDQSGLDGTRFLLLSDDRPASRSAELTRELATRLTGLGVAVSVAAGADAVALADPDTDGVILLDLEPDRADAVLIEAYATVREVLRHEPRWFVAVSPAGEDRLPSGMRGFARSVAREYPDILARAVELRLDDVSAAAGQVVDELLMGEALAVSSYGDGERTGLRLVAADLGFVAASGAGPAGAGVAEVQALGLTADSVVLLVGGARGITAQTALAIATAAGCHIELAGRTPAPDEPEPAAIAAATTVPQLSAALIAGGLREPAAIERAASAVLARREVAATLAELERVAASVRYQAVDVRQEESVRRLVKDVYTEHGRLDGVVYGAGVIADGLIAQKDADTFARVLSTKIDGARVLLDAVEELPAATRFAAMFGSIAAVLGNRGQSDYAAANDALEQLARGWSRRTGQRALTVHWGPWHPAAERGGMVSPELARHFERRGTELLDPDEATACLLRELAYGDPDVMAVVYAGTAW